MPTLQQPEAYLGGADKFFDQGGQTYNEGAKQFMTTFIEAYGAWVETILRESPG
jgi:chromate reductase